ncbi:hypothetical protein UFOVP699_231 [uncultured Caudovirales phage]|uniref:Uncharacterized protein n=1 Tax=uncultured Caudovirales phage TaxID=2100421 RepID=A0A6J5NQR2_9CAUD|nr:hypothetical protein UFOVP699_231 [uncultured Caudovirales phage]
MEKTSCSLENKKATNKTTNMTQKTEELIDSYYSDSIELEDLKFLNFKRASNYRGTDRTAIIIYHEDRVLGITIELGVYLSPIWKFTSPMNERLFWKNAKANRGRVQEILNRFRSKVPSNLSFAFQEMYERFTGHDATATKLKDLYNE